MVEALFEKLVAVSSEQTGAPMTDYSLEDAIIGCVPVDAARARDTKEHWALSRLRWRTLRARRPWLGSGALWRPT